MADSYKLSEQGKVVIDQYRRYKHWIKTSPEWINMAHTSESTLKRFLRGEKISSDHFISICEAVGIEEWQKLVDWEDNDSTRVGSFPTPTATAQKTEQKIRGIAVSGTFSQEKKQEIEAVLELLKTLLSTCNVIISPSDNDTID